MLVKKNQNVFVFLKLLMMRRMKTRMMTCWGGRGTSWRLPTVCPAASWGSVASCLRCRCLTPTLFPLQQPISEVYRVQRWTCVTSCLLAGEVFRLSVSFSWTSDGLRLATLSAERCQWLGGRVYGRELDIVAAQSLLRRFWLRTTATAPFGSAHIPDIWASLLCSGLKRRRVINLFYNLWFRLPNSNFNLRILPFILHKIILRKSLNF